MQNKSKVLIDVTNKIIIHMILTIKYNIVIFFNYTLCTNIILAELTALSASFVSFESTYRKLDDI